MTDYLTSASGAESIAWKFFDFRLNDKTALAAKGCQIICPFVNDRIDPPCLNVLAEIGVKLIVMRCAGYNNVNVEAAQKLGIAVTRVPAYSPHAVAEHTIGLLLALDRKIYRSYNRVREMNFSLNGLVGFEIYRKTVGIVGGGKIGKVTAQILRGFEARVLMTEPVKDLEWAQKYGVEYVDFGTLLKQSDVLSLHVPLTPDTYHLLNEKTFNQVKRGAYIINTSRGKVIDTAALINALKTERVGGVALDTYEEEEGVFFEDLSGLILLDDELSRLLTFPNVIITAHQGFLTREALTEIAHITTTNILHFHNRHPFLADTVIIE